LRDIVTTLKRRAPHVQVILYPAPVQGEGAAQKIAQAIATASARAECDVLLVCRGGGSIEDLWSFNHELVARSIVGCAIPVIVGVGHETDFTIADFAADMRAATPTAAAEMAATPRADWQTLLSKQADCLRRAGRRHLADRAQTLDWLASRLISPAAYIAHERTRLQGLHTRLGHATHMPLAKAQFTLARLRARWEAQLPDTRHHRLRLKHGAQHLTLRICAQLTARRQALSALAAQLEMLNPQRTLERGYAIVSDEQGRILRAPQDLQPRKKVNVRLAEGSAEVGIASVQPTLD
jgi:exodeoxyribonuclease VII large subunit